MPGVAIVDGDSAVFSFRRTRTEPLVIDSPGLTTKQRSHWVSIRGITATDSASAAFRSSLCLAVTEGLGAQQGVTITYR